MNRLVRAALGYTAVAVAALVFGFATSDGQLHSNAPSWTNGAGLVVLPLLLLLAGFAALDTVRRGRGDQ